MAVRPKIARRRLSAQKRRLMRIIERPALRVLGSETRAKVYACVVVEQGITSKDIAEITGLYPSTVREVIIDLVEKGFLKRSKAETTGPGKKPYVYTPTMPSNVVSKHAKLAENALEEIVMLENLVRGSDKDGPKEVKVVIR